MERQNNFKQKEKIVVLYDNKDYNERFMLSEKLREKYIVSLFENPKKLGKLLDKLQELGYVGFVSSGSQEIKFFENKE